MNRLLLNTFSILLIFACLSIPLSYAGYQVTQLNRLIVTVDADDRGSTRTLLGSYDLGLPPNQVHKSLSVFISDNLNSAFQTTEAEKTLCYKQFEDKSVQAIVLFTYHIHLPFKFADTIAPAVKQSDGTPQTCNRVSSAKCISTQEGILYFEQFQPEDHEHLYVVGYWEHETVDIKTARPGVLALPTHIDYIPKHLAINTSETSTPVIVKYSDTTNPNRVFTPFS